LFKTAPKFLLSILKDRVAETEPHHFGEAGAATPCGSGTDGSGSELHVQQR
jgi:hypothetical protein